MSSIKSTTTSTGISLGAAIAVAISWSMYHSVFWAIIHGILGWLKFIFHQSFRPTVIFGVKIVALRVPLCSKSSPAILS